MSWDVVVMKFPAGFDGDWESLPDDFEAEAICTHEYLKNEIKKVLPEINNDDTAWMVLNGGSYSIEFNAGDDDPVRCITLYVRGGDEALKAIKLFCEKLACQAFDTSGGGIIDFNEEANKGFSEWRQYRDKVTNKKE